MELKEIQELIRMMSKSGLAELKMKKGDFELVLRTDMARDTITYASAPSPMVMAPAATTQAPPAQQDTKSTSPAAAPSTPEVSNNYIEIKSPMVGTFYRSPSPDKAPYIKVGDKVETGQVVCMIEAMKLFNEIESEISGTIVKILVEDAAPVEYDQVLFLVEPA
ncbi:MAG: acetyl-CoA carboxylase biotin carboxyl carrier protein [Saprospiraceae bacterium]|nr:acetyl-CoA carboxylase biotin carboxyl carrier protein [Saprospiraceae bacterium]